MAEIPTPTNEPVAQTPAGPRILIIDDDPTTLKLLHSALHGVGFEVAEAMDGKAAWLAMGASSMPQLLVVDIIMPEMDGFAFIKQVKHNDETRGIPIIVISTRTHYEDAAIFAGADAFLGKPFSKEQIVNLVKKFITPPPPPKK